MMIILNECVTITSINLCKLEGISGIPSLIKSIQIFVVFLTKCSLVYDPFPYKTSSRTVVIAVPIAATIVFLNNSGCS